MTIALQHALRRRDKVRPVPGGLAKAPLDRVGVVGLVQFSRLDWDGRDFDGTEHDAQASCSAARLFDAELPDRVKVLYDVRPAQQAHQAAVLHHGELVDGVAGQHVQRLG